MFTLNKSLSALGTPSFNDVFKNEVGNLDGNLLPLQQAMTRGSVANVEDFDVVVLGLAEDKQCIYVKAGIFYTSTIAGCACADDPTPENELTEYCEAQFNINRETAETSISLMT